MTKRPVWLVLALLALPAAWVAAQESQPAASAEDANQEFQREFDRGIEGMIGQMNKQYELDEQQQDSARQMVQDHAQEFLNENREGLFDLMQRGKALQEFMRQTQSSWEDVPDDVKKDLLDRVLPMIDAMQKSVSTFSDEFKDVLKPDQQEKLSANRQKMQVAFALAKARLKVMAGQAAQGTAAPSSPDVAASPDSGADGAAANGSANAAPQARNRSGRGRGGANDWDLYVQTFIRRYHLDEMQKAQAMEILKRYKDKAATLNAPASQPASQPSARQANGPMSPEEFRQRLSAVAAIRQPVVELFEQMKIDLERIPTAVQKQMAQQSPSSQPAEPKPQE